MSKFVRKMYHCRICEKSHSIKFPRNFAENQKRYPFVFFSIHKYSGDSDEFNYKNGADIITTFYVDKNLTIRDVDVAWDDSSLNIMSENDTENLVMFLTETINEMQEQYDSLLGKYTKLLEASEEKDQKKEENS